MKIQIKQSISFFSKHTLTCVPKTVSFFTKMIKILANLFCLFLFDPKCRVTVFFQPHRTITTNFVGFAMQINQHGIAQHVKSHSTMTVSQPMTNQLRQTETMGFV